MMKTASPSSRATQIPVGDQDIATPPDLIKYKTLPDWKIAFNLDKKQIGEGTWEINGSRAEYQTDNITVQYINNTEGMRQNFVVQKPFSENETLKLPVDLISFKVAWQYQGKTAQVEFVTENESEICCYEIEKSDNGFHFSTIGQLDARNVQEQRTYSFTDPDATSKKQYYRLKTIHHNGEIDRSRIVLLQDNAVTEILVFPNPTADILQLQLNKAYNNSRVKIVSSAGRVVKQLVASADTDQTIKIPVGNLMTGTYLLHLQTAGLSAGGQTASGPTPGEASPGEASPGEEMQVIQFVKQ